MNNDSKSRIATRLLDEATVWVARRDAGLSPRQEMEFQGWLRSDPACVDAMEQCVSAWSRLDGPRARGASDGMLLALASRQRRRTARRRLVFAGAAVMVAVFSLLQFDRGGEISASDAATVVQRTPATSRELPDGSIVEVNVGAEIAVDYSEKTRTVRLLRGEAHFEVVKDATRPFIVKAAGVSVRAVGTAFAVRLDPTEVEVLVTEGVVAVEKPAGADTTAADLFAKSGASQVPAGARVLVRLNAPAETAPIVATVTAPELEQKLAWRTPRLEFSGTRLAEAVSQLNRHNTIKLVIEEASLAEMRVSGNVRIDNPEGFVRMAEPLGLEAERFGDEIRLRRAP